MAVRTTILGSICGCVLLAGCVTEPGRSGPAVWSSVNKNGAEEAIAPLRRPAQTNARFGELAERQGRLDKARQHYKTALSHDSKSVDATLGLARLDQYAGRTQDADRGFQKALKLAPRNAKVLQSVGLFRAAQGRWTEATKLLQAAVSASPRKREYRKSLGLVLAKTEDYKGAWPHLAMSMGEGEAHYYIGSYLLERGDRPRAANQFQLAVAKSPELADAKRQLARLQGQRPRRQLAGELPIPQDRGSIRAVGHQTRSYDAGSQSAWNDNRSRRIQPRPDPINDYRSGVGDRKSGDTSGIQIIPRTKPRADNGPVSRPGKSGGGRRREAGGRSSQGLTPQQLQQWSNQQPVR